MKKNTLIAVGVLGALVVVLLVMLNLPSRAPKEQGWTVPKLATVTKVEIKDGPSTIVMEKAGETWQLTEPVKAPMSELAAKALGDLLTKGFGTDDSGAATQAESLDLGATAPTVTLYSGTEKTASFAVGKEQVVKETYVKRTWIKPEGQDKVYRAQAGLRTDLIKKLDDWREKRITNFEEPDMTGMEIAYEGQKLVFARSDAGDWTLTEPTGIAIDGPAVKRLASGAGRLRVASFADGKKLEETGLDKPTTTLTFKLKDKEPVVLMLGGAAPADPAAPGGAPTSPDRYIKLGGADWIYVVKAFTADSFDQHLGALRNKEMLTLDLKEVARVSFPPEVPGGKPIVVARDGEGWKLESPEPQALSTPTVEGALRTITRLRAKDLPDIDPTVAGLGADPAPASIEVTLQGGATTTLYVGNTTGEDGKERFVRVGADGLIFTLASWSAEKLLPKVTDLTQPAEPPMPMPMPMPGQ